MLERAAERRSPPCCLQVVKDHIKLTMTGPGSAVEEGSRPQELRDSYVAVLVARHFEAMWVHMRQGLDALPGPQDRLTDQVRQGYQVVPAGPYELPLCCSFLP